MRVNDVVAARSHQAPQSPPDAEIEIVPDLDDMDRYAERLPPNVPHGDIQRTIAFILVIAVVAQFTEMVVHKTSPLLYQVLGIFLPLITTNCAVLGVALLNIQANNGFVESALYGFGAAVGFSLVMVLFAAMRERIAAADVPLYFQGAAIALITAGLMSLAFMGFSGLVRG